MGTAIESPVYRRQHPINTSEYVHMVYRYYLRTKDIKFLKAHYPSVKKGIEFMLTLDDDSDFLVNDHSHALPESKYPANQFYDIWPWYGTSAYVAGIWLAALNCAEAISDVLAIEDDRMRYRQIFNSGLQAYTGKLWNGAYLRLYSDEANNDVDETCLANQLMLEWCNHVTELPPILERDIIDSSLQQITAWNVKETSWGMINGYHPEGAIANNDHARMVFIGEILCACMTFIYKGQPELGLKCAEEIYAALLVHGHLWDQHCIIDGTDGSPVWGKNYYSNLVAWALPMALDGEGIAAFSSGAFISELLEVQ
jgi:non-lysosomal glucosylceramidase